VGADLFQDVASEDAHNRIVYRKGSG
jgi:hypothetical protein